MTPAAAFEAAKARVKSVAGRHAIRWRFGLPEVPYDDEELGTWRVFLGLMDDDRLVNWVTMIAFGEGSYNPGPRAKAQLLELGLQLMRERGLAPPRG